MAYKATKNVGNTIHHPVLRLLMSLESFAEGADLLRDWSEAATGRQDSCKSGRQAFMRMARTGRQMRHKDAKARGRHKCLLPLKRLILGAFKRV
jgi:hypothetical protein